MLRARREEYGDETGYGASQHRVVERRAMYNERIPCRYCSGSGRGRGGYPCTYCQGIGTVNARPAFGSVRGRLLGRRAGGGKPVEGTVEQHASVRRGAWYADPFGSAKEQRWWDGTKWTDEVREAPKGDAAEAGPPKVRIAGSGHAFGGHEQVDETPAQQDAEAGFAVRMESVVGEELRVLPRDRKPPSISRCSRPLAELGRSASVGGQS